MSLALWVGIYVPYLTCLVLTKTFFFLLHVKMAVGLSRLPGQRANGRGAIMGNGGVEISSTHSIHGLGGCPVTIRGATVLLESTVPSLTVPSSPLELSICPSESRPPNNGALPVDSLHVGARVDPPFRLGMRNASLPQPSETRCRWALCFPSSSPLPPRQVEAAQRDGRARADKSTAR